MVEDVKLRQNDRETVAQAKTGCPDGRLDSFVDLDNPKRTWGYNQHRCDGRQQHDPRQIIGSGVQEQIVAERPQSRRSCACNEEVGSAPDALAYRATQNVD